MLTGLAIAGLIAAAYVISSIRIVAEHQRGVVFRLGRLLPEAKGPGMIFVPAGVDRLVRVSLLEETSELPRQEVVTSDGITVAVQAVMTFRVMEPRRAVAEAVDYRQQTSEAAQTALRSTIGEMKRDAITDPGEMIKRVQRVLDQITHSWGVRVVSVALKEPI